MFNMNKKRNKTKSKNITKNNITLLVSIILVLLVGSLSLTRVIIDNNEKKKAETIGDYKYIVTSVNDSTGEINVTLTFASTIGIDKVFDFNNMEYKIHNKKMCSFDYKLIDGDIKSFLVYYKDGTRKNFDIKFEIKRIKGEYILKNGLYVQKPNISMGYNPTRTRYMYLNSNNYLTPGNWIGGEEPENWYDYKNQQWANIYVENEGLGTYYVWIPRYCYKVDESTVNTSNQRTDIKFINVYNEYIDSNGVKTTWEDLKADGYKIPEAFKWEDDLGQVVYLDGYWITKYEVSELSKYIIDYAAIPNLTSINITGIKTNLSDTTTQIATYTYAINGEIKNTSQNPDDYVFEGVDPGNKTINVTALNSNGEIVGSMTRSFEVSEPNKPDVTNFDPSTTFYVYWDENGKEHNEIPISKDPPDLWYNYSILRWANIVTRNDGLETYYVWIPRYKYQVNNVNQRTYVKFIKGTDTDTSDGYKIPEAFWWDSNSNGVHDEGEELTGYWVSKYQLNAEEKDMKFNAELTATNNSIRVQDITGTVLSTTDDSGNTTAVPLKYEYYLNGEKKGEGTESTQHFEFTSLEENKEYTVNIIARNSSTDDFVGASTKKIKTILPSAPDVSKFDKDTTYYVIYNEDGTEKERVSIKENMPSDWYDYSRQRWANIVTTANNTETYFVWIPRYEYKITKDRGALSLTNRRLDIRFISTDIINNNCDNGYEVPEAFWWDNNSNGEHDEGEELTGYWISKYQLN